MRTSELIGPALDWAVAEAEGNVRLQYDSREGLIIKNILGWIPYRPSRAWEQGGPIIEREKIATEYFPDGVWVAAITREVPGGIEQHGGEGHTTLVAAMRAFVASKLGDEINVPAELV